MDSKDSLTSEIVQKLEKTFDNYVQDEDAATSDLILALNNFAQGKEISDILNQSKVTWNERVLAMAKKVTREKTKVGQKITKRQNDLNDVTN